MRSMNTRLAAMEGEGNLVPPAEVEFPEASVWTRRDQLCARIAALLSDYKREKRGPTVVITLGHSLGGRTLAALIPPLEHFPVVTLPLQERSFFFAFSFSTSYSSALLLFYSGGLRTFIFCLFWNLAFYMFLQRALFCMLFQSYGPDWDLCASWIMGQKFIRKVQIWNFLIFYKIFNQFYILLFWEFKNFLLRKRNR